MRPEGPRLEGREPPPRQLEGLDELLDPQLSPGLSPAAKRFFCILNGQADISGQHSLNLKFTRPNFGRH